MPLKCHFVTIGAFSMLMASVCGPARAQVTLETIVIEGSPEDGGSGSGQSGTTDSDPSTAIDGYVAESSGTGTKTNTPLREVPQSISVVTRDQLEDRGAQTLEDAIGYSAGVAVNPYGLDSRYDQFIIRGFEQNTTGVYRDGLRLPTFGFTSFRIEPYGVDHIDILRGPTSTLYGLNNPGGLVNVISKMPTEKEFGEIWASYGTHDAKTVGFDVGGPAADGKVLYRVTGLVRDADTQVDYVEDDRIFIAPALTFRPSAATTFTILANYQKDETGDTYQLLPAEGVLDGSVPRDTFLGEPDWSHLKGEQWSLGYKFEHELDPAWTVRQNLRYDRATMDYQTIYPAGGLPGGFVVRAAQDADQDLEIFQVDNQIQFDSHFDAMENTLLVGGDYSNAALDNNLGFGLVGNPALYPNPAFAAFDPLNPTYGQFSFFTFSAIPLPSDDPNAPNVVQDRTQSQEQFGLYVQDQVKFDKRWVVSLSGRQDWVTTKIEDHFNPAGSLNKDDEAFTGRAGLAYLFDSGLTPYISYSTSFYPVAAVGTTPAGELLDPEEGVQYEAGVKYQPKGYKSFVTAAVFDLTKKNFTQPTDETAIFYDQLGEVNVRGFEIEGILDFANGWKVLGAYSYWDSEITEDDQGNEGNRPRRIPENIASLWIDHTFRTGTLKGLGLGGGVRFVGERFGDNENTIITPDYTLFDAGMRYGWDGWQASLNVDNLFDEDYTGTCGAVGAGSGLESYNYCSYGEGRTATLKVGYKW